MTSESGTTISIPIGAWEKDLSSTTDTEFRTQTGLARQHKIMTTVKHFSTKSTGTEMIMIVKASLNEEKLLSADLSAGLEFAKERLRHMLPAKVEEATLIVEGENLMGQLRLHSMETKPERRGCVGLDNYRGEMLGMLEEG
ncbi:uncharacterized protein [Paramormyrops kingsleyae]|uniref:uncharacterized protein isoform X3 n=1 Tax=Paramormyrops kingsleyae TaxID=1676925 RepID=UPI003B978879